MRHHNWLLIAIIANEHTLPKSWKEFGTFLSTQHALLLRMINRTEDEDIGMLRSSLIFSVQAANSWSYRIDDVYWFLKQDNKSEKLNE